MQNSPENYSLITYLWVIVLSVWSGMASHIYQVKLGLKSHTLLAMIEDIVISGFVGVVTFFFCEYGRFDPLLTAVLVGISSHMGTRAIFLFQSYFLDKFFPDNKKENGDKLG